MSRFGIIGHPVAGSLSPHLFSAAYEGRYPYDLLDFPCFEDAWKAFLDGYDGVNVTAPFKQDAYRRVDRLSSNARLTGAVNLVVKQADGTLFGHNTDVDGVVCAVRECGLGVSSALVVGTGGAARAAVAAARQLGLPVTVTGRNLEKAAVLGCPVVELGCPELAFCLSEVPLVIYTLPSSAPVPLGLPLAGAVVLEAEYKHPQLAALPCRAYLSGRRWLLYQAIAGYSLFTGEEPNAAAMEKAF